MGSIVWESTVSQEMNSQAVPDRPPRSFLPPGRSSPHSVLAQPQAELQGDWQFSLFPLCFSLCFVFYCLAHVGSRPTIVQLGLHSLLEAHPLERYASRRLDSYRCIHGCGLAIPFTSQWLESRSRGNILPQLSFGRCRPHFLQGVTFADVHYHVQLLPFIY